MRKSGILILTWILVSYCWQPHGHVHHSEVPLHWLGNSWPCHLALSVTASSWFCMYGEITAAPPPSLPHSSWFCYRRGTLDWQGPPVSWSREATLSPRCTSAGSLRSQRTCSELPLFLSWRHSWQGFVPQLRSLWSYSQVDFVKIFPHSVMVWFSVEMCWGFVQF